MKSIKISFILIVCTAGLLLSCEKIDKDLVLENADWRFPDKGAVAFMRIFHAQAANSPSLSGTTGPQVFIYANAQKLNHANLGFGSAWPTTSVYAAIPAGPTAFDIVMARLAGTPQQPAPRAGDTLARINYTTTAGRYYSMFLVDTAPTLRVLVIDDAPIFPPEGKYRIRLVNMTANPKDTLNLYSRLEARNIIVNIAHKQNSDFLERDIPPVNVNDTLEIRKNGQTVATYTWGTTSSPPTYTPFSPVSKRIYTVVARGKDGLAGKLPQGVIITNY